MSEEERRADADPFPGMLSCENEDLWLGLIGTGAQFDAVDGSALVALAHIHFRSQLGIIRYKHGQNGLQRVKGVVKRVDVCVWRVFG